MGVRVIINPKLRISVLYAVHGEDHGELEHWREEDWSQNPLRMDRKSNSASHSQVAMGATWPIAMESDKEEGELELPLYGC